MQTTPCSPCCSTALTTNIPGAQGDAGADGAAGINAFSILAAGFSATGVAGTAHALTVDENGWMAIGQVIVVDGPVHLKVVSTTGSTTVNVTELAYTGDTTGAIAAGTTISPSGVQGELVDLLSVYGEGDYTLDATYQQCAQATTAPVLVLTQPGTYLIFATVQFDLVAATVASKSIYFKLQETVNTSAVVPKTPCSIILETTTLDYTHIIPLRPVMWKTANSDDQIELWGKLEAAIGAGSIVVKQSSIVAQRISSDTA